MQRLSLILFRYELLPDNQSLSFLPDHKIPLSFLQKELLIRRIASAPKTFAS